MGDILDRPEIYQGQELPNLLSGDAFDSRRCGATILAVRQSIFQAFLEGTADCADEWRGRVPVLLRHHGMESAGEKTVEPVLQQGGILGCRPLPFVLLRGHPGGDHSGAPMKGPSIGDGHLVQFDLHEYAGTRIRRARVAFVKCRQ